MAMHLFARPGTTSLIVSTDNHPDGSAEISSLDIRILRMIWHWLKMSDQGCNPLFRGSRPLSTPAQQIPYSILITLFNFIIPENIRSLLMRQLAHGVSESRNIPLEKIIGFPNTLSVQRSYSENAPLFNITASSFFDLYIDGFTCLLNAALNADLKTVKQIFAKTNPNMLRRFLSTTHGTGQATTCLGPLTVERTGTPLQMAIYDHDAEMVAYFKEKMSPNEFDHQAKNAFKKAISSKKCKELDSRNATALEYHQAMLEQQNSDAKKLHAGLEDAIQTEPNNRFFVAHKHTDTVSTTSLPLLKITAAFFEKLIKYVSNNSVHNPFILQHTYEIYSQLLSNSNRGCYFSQKVLGRAQSFLSARWLQHYAQGIFYLADENEIPKRSFICRDSNPHFDTRQLTTFYNGIHSFLTVFALIKQRTLYPDESAPEGERYSKTLSIKNHDFSELLQPQAESTCSCVMQ